MVMKVMKCFFVFILLQLVFRTVTGGCGSNITAAKRFNVLSLMSLSTPNGKQHNVESIVLGYMFEIEFAARFKNNTLLGYIAVDVCGSSDVLLDVLLTFLLKPNSPHIFAVYSVISFEMTQLAASILYPYNVPLYAHTNRPIIPSQLLDNPNNVFKYEIFTKYDNQPPRAKNSASPSFLLIIICRDSVDCYSTDPSVSVSVLFSSKVCLKERRLNLNNKDDIKKMNRVINHTYSDAVLVSGNIYDVDEYLKIIKGATAEKKILARINMEQYVPTYCKSSHKNAPHFYTLANCDNNTLIIDYYSTNFFVLSLIYFLIGSLNSYPQVPIVNANEFYSLVNNESQYLTGHCRSPVCMEGRELVFDKYSEENWNTSIGWTCVKCPGNKIKSFPGNYSCVECPNYLKANENKTTCYDPYQYVFLEYNDKSGLLLTTAIILSLVAMATSIFVFLRHHKTPIVMSSDKHGTLLQLTTQMTLLLSIVVLFIGKPSSAICTSRPIFVGLLLSFTTSITLSKTQKFLRIFQAKVKMNSREIIFTRAVEIFSISLLVCVSCVLLIVSFKSRESQVKEIFSENMQRIVYCTTDWHIQLQFSYITLLLLGTAVQGFRARKLPASFKETNFLTFTSFLSVVIIGVTSVIYHSQQDHYLKTIIIAVTVLFLTDINYMVHSYKTYVILFRPELNNTSVLRNQIMLKMTKKSKALV